ncbi:MAG: transketolase [Acidobacteria bacterium]|nr:MAG: transketolase [Acidobacteriota bacterium]
MRRSELEEIALRVRQQIIKMAARGGCYLGASLSCADLFVFLYKQVLNLRVDNLHNPTRDYLLLSKGHAVPALYSTLAELGFFSPERLENHLSIHDSIYWHPNTVIPGVEFHTGSLGHALSVGMGIALDILMLGGTNRVFIMMGDGELNEGSIWEACLVASAYRMDNLVAIIDRNWYQANARTEDLIPLEPLETKFESFGWSVRRINGHSFDEMLKVFSKLPAERRKPTAIIADTTRGKGVPSLEGRADRWFARLSPKEAEDILRELNNYSTREFHSKEMVR